MDAGSRVLLKGLVPSVGGRNSTTYCDRRENLSLIEFPLRNFYNRANTGEDMHRGSGCLSCRTIPFDVTVGEPQKNKSKALVMFFYEDSDLPRGIGKLAKAAKFEGKAGEVSIVAPPAGFKCKHILLVGLGKRKEADSTTLYGAAGKAAQFARDKGIASLAFMLPETKGTKIKHPAEQVSLGTNYALYTFDQFKSKTEGAAGNADTTDKKGLTRLGIVCPSETVAKPIRRQVDMALVLSESLEFTRNIVNWPSNLKTPPLLAAIIEEAALNVGGLSVRVFVERMLVEMKMNAMLAVGKGSAYPPRLVVIEYGTKGDGPTLCLVGKGITFDSGGISIKPAAGMDEMKGDMAGAAAVAGAMNAIARLKIPLHVVGVMPLCENMPSGSAQRPGDIWTAMNGKTIEVLNTDAEGRMVLADALAYSVKTYKPDYLVDAATLTGAAIVALGHHMTGLVGNNQTLADMVLASGNTTNELCWQLPLLPPYRKMIESKVADIKNIAAPGQAGTITGGAFLEHFVGETPWVHLDIAGTAWNSEAPQPGATGVGVRLFVQLASDLAHKKVA